MAAPAATRSGGHPLRRERLEQGQHALGRTLPRADHCHPAAGGQTLPGVQEVGGVQQIGMIDPLRPGWQGRAGADADGQITALVVAGPAVGVAALEAEALLARIVMHCHHLFAKAAAGELIGGPAAVVVILAARDLEVVVVVEGVEPVVPVQVVEVAQRMGRVGQGDQVGQEGHLQRGARQQEPLVPAEGRFAVQKHPAQLGMPVQQGGQPQVEGADADPGDIHVCGLHKHSQRKGDAPAMPGRRVRRARWPAVPRRRPPCGRPAAGPVTAPRRSVRAAGPKWSSGAGAATPAR